MPIAQGLTLHLQRLAAQRLRGGKVALGTQQLAEVADGDEGFTCTFTAVLDGPVCPEANFEVETSGIHYIIVNGSLCEAENAMYEIAIDGSSTDPELTLIADDVSGYVEEEIQHTVTGSATITDWE